MKRQLMGLSRRYALALQKYLAPGSQASVLPARRLGRQAVGLRLETLDVARIHEGALAKIPAAGRGRPALIKRANIFFAEAVVPIEQTHRAALKADVRLNQANQTLARRTVDLAASNRSLKQSTVHRKTAEEALKKSGGQSQKLLEDSRRLQSH